MTTAAASASRTTSSSAATQTTGNETATRSDDCRIDDSKYRLPGRNGVAAALVDCKNSLQSHSVAAEFANAVNSSTVRFCAPNGATETDPQEGPSLDLSLVNLTSDKENGAMDHVASTSPSSFDVTTVAAVLESIEPTEGMGTTTHNEIIYEPGGRPIVPAQNTATASNDDARETWKRQLFRHRRSIGVILIFLVATTMAASFCTNGWCTTTTTRPSHHPPLATVGRDDGVSVTQSPTTLEPPTMSPPPPALRANQIIALINEVTLSNQNITLVDSYYDCNFSTSAEELALRWIVVDDPLQLSPDSTFNSSRLIQRYALSTLWVQLPLSHPLGVNSGPDECDWEGISCNATDMGIVTDLGDHSVTAIELAHVDWVGRLVPDLGLLSALTHFEMAGSDLTGSLPDTIGGWTHLVSFGVVSSRTTGSLPATIGEWTDLVSFDVFNSRINGSLPECIGNWTNLQFFDGSYNEWTGTLPQFIGKWTLIGAFHINVNQLTGSLPESIGKWTDITVFDAGYNELTGTMPISMEQWTSIEILWVSVSNLVGDFPLGLCEAVNLTSIEFADYVNCTCDRSFCECGAGGCDDDFILDDYIDDSL